MPRSRKGGLAAALLLFALPLFAAQPYHRTLEANPGAHAFNLGNGQGFSVREVIAAASAVSGSPIAHAIEPRRPGDPSVLVATSAKARELLGWTPVHATLEPIIESALRWHRAPRF